MNTFVNSVSNQEVRTTNGMKAVNSTSNDVVDLFFKIGASRGKDILPQFTKALYSNLESAIRVALWARDVRGGAGERKLFTDIVSYLSNTNAELAIRVLNKVPELGRWKDLVDINYKDAMGVKFHAFNMIKTALMAGDGLCAKWMPRKGEFAVELRNYLGWTPKFYRKTLVGLTKVVETQMCDKNWNEIEFSHVPSLASARYRKAFNRNATEAYAQFVAKLEKGETTVNTGAVYPHDVIRNLPDHHYGMSRLDATEVKFINEQWDALPNYVGDNKILPMIDVSGSMSCGVGGNQGNLTCMQVAVSLGLYCSEKNQGAFNGVHLTFSGNPKLMKTNGRISDRYIQTLSDDWGMNTNLERAFELVLNTAMQNNVAPEDMPETILIFSDMQFDRCAHIDMSAHEMIKLAFEKSGYTAPNVVFWNLNAYDNVPVKFNDSGVALVSGFSPAILESILSGEDFTPVGIMNRAIMDERYDF